MTDLSTKSAAGPTAEAFFVRYAYPDWLRQHSLVAGRVAEVLGRALERAGQDVDPERLALAGYLHDVGKTPLFASDGRPHNELSALVLIAEGLPQLAELARRHPIYSVLDPDLAPRTLEEKAVFYADRRAAERVVSLDERLAGQIVRHPGHADDMRRSLEITREIEREIFAHLDFGPGGLAERVA